MPRNGSRQKIQAQKKSYSQCSPQEGAKGKKRVWVCGLYFWGYISQESRRSPDCKQVRRVEAEGGEG